MAAYGTKNLLDDKNTAVVVGNSETDLPVSVVDQLDCESARDMYIFMTITSSTIGGTPSVKLQHSDKKDGTFADVASPAESVTITGDGEFEIEVARVLGTASAIKPFIRIVVTTGAGDDFTISALSRTRRISY